MLSVLAEWIEWLGITGPHVFAFAVGAVFAIVVTQAAKKAGHFGGRYAFLTAIAAAFPPAYTLSPPTGLKADWLALWIALGAGLTATRAYRLIVAIVGRYRPELAKALGDG